MRACPALCGALALLLAASAARGQTRPLATEQAATAPMGSVVLELGADFIRSEPNFVTGRERDRWEGPLLRLVYSPADNVEVDLEWTARVGALDDPDFGDVSDFGDVALRAKLRFVEEADGRPAFGARFAVTLPETSYGNGLGPNALRMSAQLLLSKSLGGVSLHGNAGLAIHDEVQRPHEQRDFLAYGAALEWRALPSLALVAEVAGLAGRGMPGASERAEARLGLRRRLGRVVLDAAARRGLAQADGDWGATAGLAWEVR
jgi:hypothetical protein